MLDDEVKIQYRSKDQASEQEEADMQKFINFMKKKGLVMVQQTPGMTVNVTQEQVQDRSVIDKEPAAVQDNAKERRGMETDFIDNNSIVTLYHNAVQPASYQSNQSVSGDVAAAIQSKERDSSSSEDPLDTSDEADKLPVGTIDINSQRNIDQFISDVQRHSSDMGRASIVDRGRGDNPQLHCSRQQQLPPVLRSSLAHLPPLQLTKAEEMIRDAETFRTRIIDVPGRLTVDELNQNRNHNDRVYYSALLDEDYLLVGNYVDE